MMSGRDQILSAVRARKPKGSALTGGAGRQALLPPRFVREAGDLTALFLRKLESASASHATVRSFDDVPRHLATWLNEQRLTCEFILAREGSLTSLAWQDAKLHPLSTAPDPLSPMTIVSGAFAGVAETGSIAMTSNGASRPSHNLLAETHVVVLEHSRILASIEDVWRDMYAAGLPRAIAFITGPSRTADIEMTVELGVHGAVRVHVVIVG